MKIAIYSRTSNFPQMLDRLSTLIDILQQKKIEIYAYAPLLEHLPKYTAAQLTPFTSAADLLLPIHCMMTIGGDGTFLDAANMLAHTSTPLVGVSAGRLGFLATIPMKQVQQAVDMLIAGEFKQQARSMLQVEGCTSKPLFALNEVGVQKKGAAIAQINVHINGEFLNAYWADGLIVATPTGSTAYSLSAGGPVVAPDAACFTISPIAPHNLSVRPIVIPDSCVIDLEMITRSQSIVVGVDSASYNLPVGTRLRVNKALITTSFIVFDNTSFYRTLRDKLMWGADARQ
ncbi:MAG: NAD(+)/NADH kinase [Bacteroidales bacterium]